MFVYVRVGLNDLSEVVGLHLLDVVRVVVSILDPLLLRVKRRVGQGKLLVLVALFLLSNALFFDLLQQFVDQFLLFLDFLVQVANLFLLLLIYLFVLCHLFFEHLEFFVALNLLVLQFVILLLFLGELVVECLRELFQAFLLGQFVFDFLSLVSVQVVLQTLGLHLLVGLDLHFEFFVFGVGFLLFIDELLLLSCKVFYDFSDHGDIDV